MQQATTSHRFPRSAGATFAVGALVLILAIGTVVALSRPASRPGAPATAPAVSAAAQPQRRGFVDEAAYVPAVAEYTGAALGEDYLPLPAAVQPAPAARVALGGRAFADEAAYVPVVGAYAGVALGEDYLPLAAPVRAVMPARSWIFSNEIAGAALPAGPVELSASAPSGPEAGPR
ncbi:MAG TPA: hypothetical protein PKD53_16105 [Chloroflexaceae bacterium]|nr:hypothetical protein [Chloroflexaceae bacterium]